MQCIRAGLDPTLKLNGIEMTNALSKRYEDDMDARLAAADLGLTKDQYEHAVDDADKKFRPLLRRLQQATVPFDQLRVRSVNSPPASRMMLSSMSAAARLPLLPL